MTDAATTPTNNIELEQNDGQIIEVEMALANDFEDTREVENEYFVLGYN